MTIAERAVPTFGALYNKGARDDFHLRRDRA